MLRLVSAQSFIQIPIESKANNLKIINLKENGLMVCQKTENEQIQFRKYDANLLFEWEIKSQFNSKYTYLDDYYDGNFLYIVFDSDRQKTLEIFKIAVNIAVVNQITINTMADFRMTHFKANENLICLAGIVNKEPLLIFSNVNSKIPRYVSINVNKSKGIQSLDINNIGDVVITLLRTDISKSEIIYRVFTPDGKTKETLFLTATESNEFLSSRFFQLGNKTMIIGNYGSLILYKEDLQNSQGMYIAELAENKPIRFYNLDQFKNAFNFLPEKQQEKLQKQIQKRKAKGKEYKFSYRLEVNELNTLDDKLLISAELFEPVFKNSNNNIMPISTYSLYNPLFTGRSFFYNPNYYYNTSTTSNRSTRYFEGYRYLSGLVMAIDSTANLVWDNSVTFKNIFSWEIKSHMKVNVLKNKHVLSYGTGQKFQLANYANDGSYTNTLDYSSNSKDYLTRIKKNDFENFEHWYENYFLSWAVIYKLESNSGNNLTCLIQKITLD